MSDADVLSRIESLEKRIEKLETQVDSYTVSVIEVNQEIKSIRKEIQTLREETIALLKQNLERTWKLVLGLTIVVISFVAGQQVITHAVKLLGG